MSLGVSQSAWSVHESSEVRHSQQAWLEYILTFAFVYTSYTSICMYCIYTFIAITNMDNITIYFVKGPQGNNTMTFNKMHNKM